MPSGSNLARKSATLPVTSGRSSPTGPTAGTVEASGAVDAAAASLAPGSGAAAPVDHLSSTSWPAPSSQVTPSFDVSVPDQYATNLADASTTGSQTSGCDSSVRVSVAGSNRNEDECASISCPLP